MRRAAARIDGAITELIVYSNNMTAHKDLKQYLDYAQHVEVSKEVEAWLTTTLNNYLHKATPEVSEVEHIIDYLAQNEVKKVNQMSYDQAIKCEYFVFREQECNHIKKVKAGSI
jgi:hypothetical protein